MRRVFNNSRWDQGGRFYGGWWQRCPSARRVMIEFDGVATAEIDYSGIHIVILYAQVGINYWKDIKEDPYKIDELAEIEGDIDLRKAAKLLLLMALNAENEDKTFRAFRFQSQTGSTEKGLTNEQLSSILIALKEKHKPIAHKLASGAGIDLMFIDSQITEEIIKTFTYKHKCPILTVHDSYVVPFGYDHILEKVMKAAFEKITGISDVIVKHTTDYYTVLQQELDPEDQDAYKHPYWHSTVSARHLKEVELFREFKGKPDREDWVPEWTDIY